MIKLTAENKMGSNNKVEGGNTMTNLTNDNKNELVEGGVNMRNTIATAAEVMNKYTMNKNKSKAIKLAFKSMPVVLQQGLEFKLEDFTKQVHNFKAMASQESNLFRAVDKEIIIIADEAMALKGIGTRHLLSVKIDKTILSNSQKVYIKAVFAKLRKGMYVVYNTKTGATKLMEEKKIKAMNLGANEVCYKYMFLGVTPSGLGTGTIMTSAVNIFTPDGTVIECDNRQEILDKSLDGAFIIEDENGNKIDLKGNKETMFKFMTRLLQGSPSSMPLFTAKNYIIVDNLAGHAMYNAEDTNTPCTDKNIGIDCSDTTDGTQDIVNTNIQKALASKGIELSLQEVTGLIMQTRGASSKSSSVVRSKETVISRIMSILSARGKQAQSAGLYLFASENEAGLLSLVNTRNKAKSIIVVCDGIRYEGKEVTMGLINKTLKNIEMLADWNAFKIRNFNPEFDVVSLKQGYLSDTKLTMVVNLMMQSVDPIKTKEIISKLVKKEIASKFEELGLKVETDDNGNVIALSFNDKNSTVNNDAQIANFLKKNNPEMLSMLMPQVDKSLIRSTLESIKNLISELNPKIESYYTVVHADPSVLYGVRILEKGEMHCNDFDATELCGVRHPISSLKAVTTFNKVTTVEIIERIAKLNASEEVKAALTEHYVFAKGFATVYASHDLMQKHDGMDWDIDAMQFIIQEEVVSILKQIKDVTTIIDRDKDIEAGISTSKSKDEVNIDAFRVKGYELDRRKKEEVFEDNTNYMIHMNQVKVTNSYSVEKTFTSSFEDMLDIVEEFFICPVAGIGLISTGFYNNQSLEHTMKNKNTSDEFKENVAFAFFVEFGCSCNQNIADQRNEYVSPKSLVEFITREGNVARSIHKQVCTDIVMNFANSDSSVEDVIAFLHDCNETNRYAGETSIDAAKNDFKISDIYNNSYFVKSLGASNNTKIELDDNDNLFTKIVESYNKMNNQNDSTSNAFGVKLLDVSYSNKIHHIEKMSQEEIAEVLVENKNARNANKSPKHILGCQDDFSELKISLASFTNTLIVLAIKLIEGKANSIEAKEMRKKVIGESSALILDKKIENPELILNTLLGISIAVNNSIGSASDFSEQNSIIYKKETAIKILKNTAALMLKGLNQKEIGLVAIAWIASKYETTVENNETVANINRTILTVFEEEIYLYLNSIGFNTVAGEKVVCVQQGVKVINETILNNATITFENGIARYKDMVITSENKKSNNTGVVSIMNGRAVVLFNKTFTEKDSSLGIYLGVNMNSNTLFLRKHGSMTAFEKVEFCKSNVDLETGKVSYSNLIGHYKGKEFELLSLVTSKLVKEMLSVAEANYEIFYEVGYRKVAKTKEALQAKFVHANSEMLEAIIEDSFAYNEISTAETLATDNEDLLSALMNDISTEVVNTSISEVNMSFNPFDIANNKSQSAVVYVVSSIPEIGISSNPFDIANAKLEAAITVEDCICDIEMSSNPFDAANNKTI